MTNQTVMKTVEVSLDNQKANYRIEGFIKYRAFLCAQFVEESFGNLPTDILFSASREKFEGSIKFDLEVFCEWRNEFNNDYRIRASNEEFGKYILWEAMEEFLDLPCRVEMSAKDIEFKDSVYVKIERCLKNGNIK